MLSYNESYQIEDSIIGKGQFGEIKPAKSKKDQNLKICVKLLEKEPNCGKYEVTIQQEQELNMCRQMINKNYENLVQIYDVYDSDVKDKMAYIFMERCDLNLHQLMKQKKQNKQSFSKEKLIDIIKQIVKGYNSLIFENIIHRDLKPENILCNLKNDELTIKIADFGISKNLNTQSNSQMTKKLGTPYYNAPEIKDNQTISYDNKCDIFSLGVIIFELALLERQFKSKEKEHLINETFSELHKKVFELREIDKDIIQLLDRMIVYDPNKRITWEELSKFYNITPQHQPVQNAPQHQPVQNAPYHQPVQNAPQHQPVQNAPNMMTQPQQTIPTFGQFCFTPTLNQNLNQISPQPLALPVNVQQQHIQNVAQNQEQIQPKVNQQNIKFKKQNSLDPDNQKILTPQQETIRYGTTKNQQQQQFINMKQQQIQQNPKLNNGQQPVQQEQGPQFALNGQQKQQGFQFAGNGQQIQQGLQFAGNGQQKQQGLQFAGNGQQKQQGLQFAANGQQQQQGLQFAANGQQQQQGFKGQFPSQTNQLKNVQFKMQGYPAKEEQLEEQKQEVKKLQVQTLQSNNKTNQCQIYSGLSQFQNNNAQMRRWENTRPIGN